jgi:cell division protein FtsB
VVYWQADFCGRHRTLLFHVLAKEITSKAQAVKFLPAAFLTLILAIQYPLWFGKGGWFRVWEVSKQVEQQKAKNKDLASRNAGLDAEVRDLKAGGDAVEERARVQLGMIRPDEVFYQVVEKGK